LAGKPHLGKLRSGKTCSSQFKAFISEFIYQPIVTTVDVDVKRIIFEKMNDIHCGCCI